MKAQIATLVSKILNIDESIIEVQTPSNTEFGDFSVPCFAFSKILKMSPKDISLKLVECFSLESVDHTEAVNGYFNIFLSKQFLYSTTLLPCPALSFALTPPLKKIQLVKFLPLARCRLRRRGFLGLLKHC